VISVRGRPLGATTDKGVGDPEMRLAMWRNCSLKTDMLVAMPSLIRFGCSENVVAIGHIPKGCALRKHRARLGQP